MTEDKEQGIKRIRIVASLISGVLFFMTAVTQFQGEPIGSLVAGVLFSTVIGFGFMWIAVTIIKLVMRLFRR